MTAWRTKAEREELRRRIDAHRRKRMRRDARLEREFELLARPPAAPAKASS